MSKFAFFGCNLNSIFFIFRFAICLNIDLKDNKQIDWEVKIKNKDLYLILCIYESSSFSFKPSLLCCWCCFFHQLFYVFSCRFSSYCFILFLLFGFSQFSIALNLSTRIILCLAQLDLRSFFLYCFALVFAFLSHD